MSINLIQCQQGLSMTEFKRYGAEAKATLALSLAAGSTFIAQPVRDGRARALSVVRRSTTSAVPAGTRRRCSAAPCSRRPNCRCALGCWPSIGWTSTKTNVAALELKRHLGVGYKTAWRIKHKVTQAMVEREAPRRLSGFVQLDDADLRGLRLMTVPQFILTRLVMAKKPDSTSEFV